MIAENWGLGRQSSRALRTVPREVSAKGSALLFLRNSLGRAISYRSGKPCPPGRCPSILMTIIPVRTLAHRQTKSRTGRGATSLQVKVPPDGNIAATGCYLLFVVDMARVPSVAAVDTRNAVTSQRQRYEFNRRYSGFGRSEIFSRFQCNRACWDSQRELDITSVKLRERKNRFLVRKRHQIKHSDF
jgi:hypothetical protein